jgi:hypothetical protein
VTIWIFALAIPVGECEVIANEKGIQHRDACVPPESMQSYSEREVPATSSSAASVCAVQREPGRFAGRSLWLSGQLEGDGMHWITLTDPSCHDFGLEIKIAKDFEGTRDYLTMLGGPRAVSTIVRGEFFGYLKKKEPGF